MGQEPEGPTNMAASSDSSTNISVRGHWYSNLSVYDFQQSAERDWDKTFEGAINQLQFTSWNGLNIGRLTLTIWILASHLALILLVICKASLRSQPKYLLVVNVSLTNVLLGVFLVPGKLHFTLRGGHCPLYLAWTLLNEYYQVCVSLLAVFALVLERLVYVYTERRATFLTRQAKWLNCVLYCLLPWVLGLILILPLFYEALAQRVPHMTCAWHVRDHYFLALQVMSYLPAALAVLMTAPLAGLWDCLRQERCAATPSTPKGESLVIAVLVSVVAVCGETPYSVVRTLLLALHCQDLHCANFHQGLSAGMWLRLAKAAVTPFIWLVYSDLRHALLCHLTYHKLPRHDKEIEDDDESNLVNNTRL